MPVGSVLCFTNNTNPNDIYQGTTWQKIEGRFLLGSSSVYALGSTGGEVTHTLTVDEMPSHNHEIMGYTSFGQGTGSAFRLYGADGGYGYTTKATGNNVSHNNMPPYKVVNYWERVA